jgi:hypothetical protein
MKTYRVIITETATHEVLIEAETREEAEVEGLEAFVQGDAIFVASTDQEVIALEQAPS